MGRIRAFLTGAGLGAGFMYFYDPVVGNRRRALLEDQIAHLFNKAGDAVDTTWRDLQNRATGLVAEVQSCVTADEADDDVLVQRVRSKMGRYVSHPSAIEIEAHDGTVTLSGPILSDEVQGFVRAVRSVRGVSSVENHLEVHSSSENVSALQGGRQRTGEPFEFMQENWSPTARLLAGMTGSKLMLNCLARQNPISMLLGAAGCALMTRALTNQPVMQESRLSGSGGGDDGSGDQTDVSGDQSSRRRTAQSSTPSRQRQSTSRAETS